MNHQGEIHPTEEAVTILARDYKGLGLNPFNGVMENFPDNANSESRGRESIDIRTNTRRGYEQAFPGDSVNLSFPSSETRRGRVGHGVAQTLLTGIEQGVVTDE